MIAGLMANVAFTYFQFSRIFWSFDLSHVAVILEALLISSITIWQKRRQQAGSISLLQEHTARVKAQTVTENLKRLERQKDDFIAIAAHELKKPLASIKAFTQTLKGRVKSKTSKQYVTRLELQISRLEELVT